MDFDDLIALPIGLSPRTPPWRRSGGSLRLLLVDEYQDINPVRRLNRLLVGEPRRSHRVGDDDQAIYGARGASVETAALPKDFPALNVVKLEQNYRSTVRIRLSERADRGNPKLFEKKLWSERGHGDPIRVSPAADARPRPKASCAPHGASFRASRPLRRLCHSIAATTRRNLRAKLREQNVPYEISAGQSYFERAEIKDIVSYLR